MNDRPNPTTAAQIAILADAIEDLYYRMAWHSNRNECYAQIRRLRNAIPKAEATNSGR